MLCLDKVLDNRCVISQIEIKNSDNNKIKERKI